jgi:hypothetical protein
MNVYFIAAQQLFHLISNSSFSQTQKQSVQINLARQDNHLAAVRFINSMTGYAAGLDCTNTKNGFNKIKF